MSVTVLTGRSGSGKSRFLMKLISGYIKDPFAKVIVIVPGQLTFETEKNIMEQCGVAGILGLEVMSIQRLAFRVLEDTGSVSFISNAQKALYLSRALGGEAFGGISDLEDCTASLMTRLKSFCQTPETLRAAAVGIKDEELSGKLLKIALVYERYLELCGGRPDAADMYAMAAAAAPRAEFLKGAHIVIDGLDSASPAVLNFLTEVIRQGSDAVAAFRSGSEAEGDLFSSEREDMRRFIEAAKRSGKNVTQRKADEETRYGCAELAYLEANLYRYPYRPYDGAAGNIRMLEAENLEAEVDMIASGILEEVRRGRRFRDVAIAVGGIDAYLPAIKTKFASCGIPYFFDERRTLSDNTFYEFLHDALAAAAGDMGAAEGYVYSAYSPLTFEERVELKKYAKKYALRGWHFFKEFYRGDERAERLRRSVMEPLLRLARGIEQGTAEKQISAVERFLSDCEAERKLEALCERLAENDENVEQGYFAQVLEKSIEALRGIADVFGQESIEPRSMARLLSISFGTTKIALIPPATDEVGVFDISVARLPGIDVLFAAGVHDGVWPAKDDGPGVLSRAEREALFDAGLDIGVYDASAEKLKVYTALSKPKQRLYISYNTQSGQPSVLVDRIKRLLPGVTVSTQPGYASAEGARARVLGDIAGALAGAADERLPGMCALMMKQPGWSDKARRMLLRTNAAVPVDKSDAARLYGGIRCSATRIEDYYKCPYKHFLDFGVKAEQERDYTDDRVDIGTYMHLSLDLFVKTLLEDGVDIKELSEAETERRMEAAAVKAAELHEDAKLLRDERFVLRFELLKKELINTALRIRTHFIGSGASILLSEQEFSGYRVDTEFGDIEITGKIDRIDAADGYFRVVDYKSSETGFSLKDFTGGVRIQLPLYIGAAQRVLKAKGLELKPTGGYYMRIGDAYKGSANEVAKDARLTGISLRDEQALSRLSALNEDGSFTAIDQAVKLSGELKSSARHFEQDELEKLVGHTDELIKKAAGGIYGGDNAINPAMGTSGGDVCEYCSYGSVCMMDQGYEGNTSRQIGQDADEAEGGGTDGVE